VQARRHIERIDGGPERLSFGTVVAPVFSGYSVIIAPDRPRRARAGIGPILPF
jgi:hypothetical protein